MSSRNYSHPDPTALRIFQASYSLVLVTGVLINYKLFRSTAKETFGEKGKVLQRIMKNYAIVQAFGWPTLVFPSMVLMSVQRAYGNLVNPCIYVYGCNLVVFFYCFLRFYAALNSLIIAFGRYAFVVHDNKVLNFGADKMRKILILASVIIPLMMSIWFQCVATLSYNGYLSEIKEYELSCYSSVNKDKVNISEERDEVYKFPLYKLTYSVLPPWAMNGLYVFYIVVCTILFSNITEGIIYIKSAIFVFRYKLFLSIFIIEQAIKFTH